MAIRDLTARIRITADTRGVQKGLKQAERSVGSFEKNLVKSAAAVAGGFVAARFAVDEFSESAARAGQKVALQRQLDATGESLDEFLEKLDDVAQGTIATADLIQQSSNALLLGIPADAIVTLLEQARVAAIATGQDVSKAFQDITLGVARQSRLILDNLGIIIKVEEANEKYAEQLGKTVKELDSAQRQQAFLNEVLRIGKGRVDSFGDAASTNAIKLAQLAAEAKNAVDRLADLANQEAETDFVTGEFVEGLKDLFQVIAGSETLTEQAIDRARRLAVQFGADSDQAKKAAASVKDLGSFGSRAVDLLTRSSDTSIGSLAQLIFQIKELLELFGLLPEPIEQSAESSNEFQRRVDDLIESGFGFQEAFDRATLVMKGNARAARIAAEEAEALKNATEGVTEETEKQAEVTEVAAEQTGELAEQADRAAQALQRERIQVQGLNQDLNQLNETGVITGNTFDRIARTQGEAVAVAAAIASGATFFGRRLNLRGGGRLINPINVPNINSAAGVSNAGGNFQSTLFPGLTTLVRRRP